MEVDSSRRLIKKRKGLKAVLIDSLLLIKAEEDLKRGIS